MTTLRSPRVGLHRYPLVTLLPEVDENDPLLGRTEPIVWAPPIGVNANFGRVQVLLWPLSWGRGRGEWPRHWRTWPDADGPIFRWWRLGPIDVRLFPRR